MSIFTPGILKLAAEGISEEYKYILFREPEQAKRFKTFVQTINKNVERGQLSPEPENIFNAFKKTSWDNLKVVLIGQDPFIKQGEATGLSFSVPREFPIPPSTKKIYSSLIYHKLLNFNPKEYKPHGNLESWAEQGILMLNASLTTVLGKSNEHKFWHPYTDAIIKYISDNKKDIIFVLWGNFAKSKSELIDLNKHFVLKWGHPSPLNRANNDVNDEENFMYCNHFSKINEILQKTNRNTIKWNSIKDTFDKVVEQQSKVITEPESEQVVEPEIEPETEQVVEPEIEPETKEVAEEVVEPETEEVIEEVTEPETEEVAEEVIEPEPEEVAEEVVEEVIEPEPEDITQPNIEEVVEEVTQPNTEEAIEPKQVTKYDRLYLFTDGSAKDNKTPEICKAGYGFAVFNGKNELNSGYGSVERKTIDNKNVYPSNSRAELMAIQKGTENILEMLKNNVEIDNLEIVTDSRYCRMTIVEWYANWEKNPKLRQKKLNLDIIDDMMKNIRNLEEKLNLTVTQVKAHQKEPSDEDSHQWLLWHGNDRADALANDGAI